MSQKPLYLAVDIGTGSVRAAIFSPNGDKLAHAERFIKTRNPAYDHYEQSTDDIWQQLTSAVREVCHQVPHSRNRIAGLGIDATCSLVACAHHTFQPVSISLHPSSDNVYNVLLWLDHRASAEANYINQSTNHAIRQVRAHYGDVISPENEPPKLLWLSNHLPHVIRDCLFFDLADWVAFRCCGDPHRRSSCTVASKWGWGSSDGEKGEWCTAFWDALGLSELCDHDFQKIGRQIISPGCPTGRLNQAAADELGLTTECVVASPMVDASAGALWAIGLEAPEVKELAPLIEHRLSVIAGTSTCYLQLSRNPLYVRGVWGPFRDVILPGYHVSGGGQSVSGKLLENTIKRHVSYPALKKRVGEENVHDELTEMTERLVKDGEPDPAEDMHCLDHHAGNRSPLADPSLKGAMVGLSLEEGEFDLAVKYRATVQALCCGARFIVNRLRDGGHDIRILTACGGMCKSRFLLQELADCLSVPIAVSKEEDTVLLGSAILAKCAHSISNGAGKLDEVLRQAASDMSSFGEVVIPNAARAVYFHRKYAVYRKLQQDFQSYRLIIEGKGTASLDMS